MKLIKDYVFYGNDHEMAHVPSIYKTKEGEIFLGMNIPLHHKIKKYDWETFQRGYFIKGQCPKDLVDRQPTMLVDYHSMTPQFQECADGTLIAAFNAWDNIPLGTEKADQLLRDKEMAPHLGTRMLHKNHQTGTRVTSDELASLLGYDPIKEGEADELGVSLPITIVRSTDKGQSWHPWGHIYDIPEKEKGGQKFRGNMLLLPSGELLFVVYVSDRDASLYSSLDHGKTWKRKSYLNFDNHNEKELLNEATLYRHASGRITVVARTWTSMKLAIAHSDDEGLTWVEGPRLTNVWGFPPFLMPHSSGKVLLLYYRRRSPKGLYAKLLKEDLSDIDDAEVLELTNADGEGVGGGGYPQAIELDDASILIVYHDRLKPYETYKVLGKQYKI